MHFFLNNVAKGIRLLDKKAFLCIQEPIMQVRAFERYIPLNKTIELSPIVNTTQILSIFVGHDKT